MLLECFVFRGLSEFFLGWDKNTAPDGMEHMLHIRSSDLFSKFVST